MESKAESRCWQMRENDAQEVRILHDKNQILLGVGDGKEGLAGQWWGRKCECDPWKTSSSTKPGWSNWLDSIHLLDWTKEKATEFGKTKLLEVLVAGGNRLTGRAQSVPMQKHTSSSYLWPPMTFSAFPSLPSPFPWPCPPLLPVMFIFTS